MLRVRIHVCVYVVTYACMHACMHVNIRWFLSVANRRRIPLLPGKVQILHAICCRNKRIRRRQVRGIGRGDVPQLLQEGA